MVNVTLPEFDTLLADSNVDFNKLAEVIRQLNYECDDQHRAVVSEYQAANPGVMASFDDSNKDYESAFYPELSHQIRVIEHLIKYIGLPAKTKELTEKAGNLLRELWAANELATAQKQNESTDADAQNNEDSRLSIGEQSRDHHEKVHRARDEDFASQFEDRCWEIIDECNELVQQPEPAVYSRTIFPDEEQRPVSQNDMYANMLKFMQGALLIQQNLPYVNEKDRLKDLLKPIYDELKGRIDTRQPFSQEYAYRLHDDLCEAIASVLEVSPAQAIAQLFFARDEALSLVTAPKVKTVIEMSQKDIVHGAVRTERSSQPKPVPGWFFDKYFYDNADFDEQSAWYQVLLTRFGIQENLNWIREWYKENLKSMKAAAMPAFASSRGKPLPAGVEHNDVSCTVSLEGQEVSRQASWIRIGTPLLFKCRMSDKEEEERFKLQYATDYLREVITDQLLDGVRRYVGLYGVTESSCASDKNFFISYASLLSPTAFLGFLDGHIDNNDYEMVKVAKLAMKQLELELLEEARVETANEGTWNTLLNQVRQEFPFMNVQFTQVNHAVNYMNDTHKLAGKITSHYVVDYEEDLDVLNLKLGWVDTLENDFNTEDLEQAHKTRLKHMLSYIKGEIRDDVFNDMKAFHVIDLIEEGKLFNTFDDEFRSEIVTRLRASIAMRAILNNELPYADLSKSQVNIMRAALEMLVTGRQGIVMVGCKSWRERYGVVADACASMLENKKAMRDWGALEEGIKRQTDYGHNLACNKQHVNGVQKIWQVNHVFSVPDSRLQVGSKENRMYIKPTSYYLKYTTAVNVATNVGVALAAVCLLAVSPILVLALAILKATKHKQNVNHLAERNENNQRARARFDNSKPPQLPNRTSSSDARPIDLANTSVAGQQSEQVAEVVV